MNNSHNKIELKAKTRNPKKVAGFTAVFMVALVVQVAPVMAAIVNTATATGSYGGNGYLSNGSSAAVNIATHNRSMLVTKTASPTTNVATGDVVTYTYTVTNNGNVTLTNINLVDVHNAAGPAPIPLSETLTDGNPLGDSTDATPNDGVWSVLAPGDTVTLTATYTVRQSDVDNLQ
jgi:large repetitive protein